MRLLSLEFAYEHFKTRFVNINKKKLNENQQEFFIEENQFIAHTGSFIYLGFFITNSLKDGTDIDARIKSASKMFE